MKKIVEIFAVATEPFVEMPLTTGAIFAALVAAITYLARSRDRDRHRELSRLEAQICRLQQIADKMKEGKR